MSLRDEIHRQRDAMRGNAGRYGATNLRLFGSVARGEDRPDSDVDLLADLPPGMSLLSLGRVQAELEDILGTRVDLVAGTLKPEVRARARARANHDLHAGPPRPPLLRHRPRRPAGHRRR